MSKIGWKFPPTHGGSSHGYNDAGIAHFEGARLAGLARETIQNSLDARASEDEPVHVTFELQEIDTDSTLGLSDLAETVQHCIQAEDLSDKEKSEFSRGERLLRASKLTFLRVVDRNTTGLQGDNWRALVKRLGTSRKVPGAGGSFGIGKSAPFSVSPLRTVYYWSRFVGEGGLPNVKFQGKAVLVSHDRGNGETQGTGFYGKTHDCSHLSEREIPDVIGRLENHPGRGNGTSLWIAGFDGSSGWRNRVGRSVVENFFCAIQEGKLSVLIEPKGSGENDDSDLLEIDAESVDRWFTELLSDSGVQDDESAALKEARVFSNILRERPCSCEKEDQDLGHCRLWIEVGDELPSKVALIRGAGMLITSQQKGLVRFPGTRSFAAVCRFESEEGNELLRRMENPEHNQFEPDRLPPEDYTRGRRALSRVLKWIRDSIKEVAAPDASEATLIDELADLLPDIEPDDAFGPNGEGEPEFGRDAVIHLKPRRRTLSPSSDLDGGNNGGEDDDGEGDKSTDPGDGSASGRAASSGAPKSGGSRGRESIIVERVRYLPSTSDLCRYGVVFTPISDVSSASFSLAEAGDSNAIERSDLKVAKPDGSQIALSDYRDELTAGRRYRLDVVAEQPITGRAWRLSVTKDRRG